MIDVHNHLGFIDDADKVIEEAKKQGMEAIVTSVVEPKELDKYLDLERRHHHYLFLCTGLHPNHVEDYSDKEIDDYIELLRGLSNVISGIGEIGLEFTEHPEHINPITLERMRNTFSKFIEFAQEINRPIVIHTRNRTGGNAIVFDEIFKVLEEKQKQFHLPDVILHCFSGSEGNVKYAVSRGYYISFATNACFTDKHPKLIKATPLEHMLLETDAPWLDPDQPKGSGGLLTNRPWKIRQTAEVVAKIKGITTEEVLKITAENAKKVFRI